MITVDDAPTARPVRARTCALLVNGLWEAGAEAIADQRPADDGPLRDPQHRRRDPRQRPPPLSPPYVVQAIGDTRRLQAELLDTTTGLEFSNRRRRARLPADDGQCRRPHAAGGALPLPALAVERHRRGQPPTSTGRRPRRDRRTRPARRHRARAVFQPDVPARPRALPADRRRRRPRRRLRRPARLPRRDLRRQGLRRLVRQQRRDRRRRSSTSATSSASAASSRPASSSSSASGSSPTSPRSAGTCSMPDDRRPRTEQPAASRPGAPAAPTPGAPAAPGAAAAARAARSSSRCCWRWSASPPSPRCAPPTVDDTYAGLREQDLIDVLNGLAGTTQRAEPRSPGSSAPATTCARAPALAQAALAQAQQQADTLASWPALVPVTGPGHPGHHHRGRRHGRRRQLLDMIEELRTAGAEAIEINGEVRVVAQTSFEDADGGILVDGQLVDRAVRHRRDRRPEHPGRRPRLPDGPHDAVRGRRRDRATSTSSPRSTSRPS